ncbi:helix-turn-helix domain-containing protein [Fimbriiglobus ruber]|uniref:helix-turn-helix domain-containing protein n=1 Tax=Fimbriiglobus ruber TaxID=1908690 RepID=UPI00117ACE1B
MRGRNPRSLTISAVDKPILEFVAHSRHLAWFQVPHARIVLAVAAGERVSDRANRRECDRTTIWRVCRRYEHGGVEELLRDDARQGHPLEISPPSACSDRRTCLPGTRRQGIAHYPLVPRGPGSPSHPGRDR